MELIINVQNLEAEISDNKPSDYLPVKTNYNQCDWDIVSGYFIGFAYDLELTKYSKADFEEDCKQAFSSHQVSEKHFSIIHKAFFEEENYLKLGPTNLLLHTQSNVESKVNPASKKVASSLMTLLGNNDFDLPNKESEHFIGELISKTLKNKLKSKKFNNSTLTYLPYLQDKFVHDFMFLASKPSYMLDHVGNFLSIYNFLHVSQLSLNLKEWRAGEPVNKPLYFVIETEKVSSERTRVIDRGWQSIHKANESLFPMLSTLQLIQPQESRKPIWQIYKELNESDFKEQAIGCLDAYCQRFIEARNLKENFNKSESVEMAFEQLFKLACLQFDKSHADPSTTRYQANSKVVSAIKEHVAKGFVKYKGPRVGHVIVLTQDNLLLLTNLIIGPNKQLRFNDLIEEFKYRGVYFDETTEERLIEFYERIGNVERMSDSGDDLYVRQTV